MSSRPGDGELLQHLLREDRIPGEQIAIEEVLFSFVDDKFDLEAVFFGQDFDGARLNLDIHIAVAAVELLEVDDVLLQVAMFEIPGGEEAENPESLFSRRHVLKQLAIGEGELFRSEPGFHDCADVIDDLVDDLVAPDLHSRLLGYGTGPVVGDHVEADDDRIRGGGKLYVFLAYRPDRGVDDYHLHLVGGQVD